MFNNLLHNLFKKKKYFLINNENRYSRFFLLLEFFNTKLNNKFNIISKIKPGCKTYFPIIVPSYDSLKDESFVARDDILKIQQDNPEIILLFDASIEAITLENQTSELLLTFHNLLKKHKFDPKRILLLTSNSNSSQYYEEWANKFSPDFKIAFIGYNFYLFEYHVELVQNKWIIQNYNRHLKNLNSINAEKHFMCLNLRPRWHRKAVLLFLLSKNLINKGIVTYFGESFGKQAQAFTVDSPEEAEKKISKLRCSKELLQQISNLNTASPITFERDEKNIKKDLWERRPGEIEFLIPELKIFNHFNSPSTYFEIVTETWLTDEKCLFFTEKTLRPILRLNPFIIAGSPHSLKFLRKIGFKTFSPFIDESYDEIDSEIERLEVIFKEIERLCSKSKEEMQNLYRELSPILHHNFRHLVNVNNMKKVFEKEVKENILNSL